MHESLQLFDSISNGRWFQKSPFLLIFTMTDLFREKLKSVPLTVCFPEYTGLSFSFFFLLSSLFFLLSLSVWSQLAWLFSQVGQTTKWRWIM